MQERHSPHDKPLDRSRKPRTPLSRRPAGWNVRRRDIRKAVAQSNNSSPGPDGIPFGVWRALGHLGTEILLDVAEFMEKGEAEVTFIEAYQDECQEGEHNYNTSTLVCLPKEATGEDPELGAYYAPSATRPLSIVNADNRIIASAMRARWEEHLKLYVRERQQGFLKGRSMIKNLLEVETAMLLTALEDDKGAAIFLDFEAAFPSIAQGYTATVLKQVGVPQTALNSFNFLYNQSKCEISVKGSLYEGFKLEAGVRQGCPLSPLVYALVAEVLLDKMELEVEGLFARAYADDTAIILKNWEAALPKLENIFTEFNLISGLKLNYSKCIVIPLNDRGKESNEEQFYMEAGIWKDMGIHFFCQIPGFLPRPGQEEHVMAQTIG